MTELVIRLVFSLAIVVGILLLLARVAGRRFQGKTGAAIQVVHRQSLSRGSGVAVVTVGERILVLGTTDQQVTLLTELEPDELELAHDDGYAPAAEEPRAGAVSSSRPSHRSATQSTTDGRLAGSVLSPETWRQALRFTRGTTGRTS